MAPESALFSPTLLLAVGLFTRYTGFAATIVGATTPVVDAEFTAEFVGDFVIVIGLATLALTLAELTSGRPEPIWTAFAGAVVLAVIAMPALLGQYVEWHAKRPESV